MNSATSHPDGRGQLFRRRSLGDFRAELSVRHALDRQDWDHLALVFAEDAVKEFAGLAAATGPAAIAEACARALSPLEGSQHLVGSSLVRLDEGHAARTRPRSPGHVHVRTAEGELALFTVAGDYDDRAKRRSEGWRITGVGGSPDLCDL